MRVVDLDGDSPFKRVTVLSYGAMRSGKTRWAATFPRPIFLSDNTETGWTTIKNMDPNAFFEPGRRPVVWAIEKASDMGEALAKLEGILANSPGQFLTVVVDSLTFYADLYFNWLDTMARGAGRPPDTRQLYGNLAAHMREIRIRVHNLNINVVWLCLEKQPTNDEPQGGPMLSGQSAQKFAAGCDYIFFHRSFQVNPTAPLQWDIRTKRYCQYQAGGRDEGRLPDPLGYIDVSTNPESGQEERVWVPDTTYRTFAMALGITEEEALTIPPPPAFAVPVARVGAKPESAPTMAAPTKPEPVIAAPTPTAPTGPVRAQKPVGKPVVASRNQ